MCSCTRGGSTVITPISGSKARPKRGKVGIKHQNYSSYSYDNSKSFFSMAICWKMIYVEIIVKCIMVVMEIFLVLRPWYSLIKTYFCFKSFKTWDFCHNQMLQSWQTRNMATFDNYIWPKSLFVSCLTPIEIFYLIAAGNNNTFAESYQDQKVSLWDILLSFSMIYCKIL